VFFLLRKIVILFKRISIILYEKLRLYLGRSLGSAIVLEFLLYYMTKPEYQLKVREEKEGKSKGISKKQVSFFGTCF